MDQRIRLIGMPVDELNMPEISHQVLEWATRRESRYICVANVHMAVETRRDSDLKRVVEQADIVTTDGMPLVWMLRLLGSVRKQRTPGRDQMLELCRLAEEKGIPVGFVGGKQATLTKLVNEIQRIYPLLNIAYANSPPFRVEAKEEEAARIAIINQRDVAILFVGLGCPKQEKWMYRHKGSINSVMLGVGAAFDFLSGEIKTSPIWMQRVGLEWVHRLLQEPGRLWRRYLTTNTVFLCLGLAQLARTFGATLMRKPS